MGKTATLPIALMALCGAAYAQGILEPHAYMRDGVIEHHQGTATVKVDFEVPIRQAVTAIREEYGWVIDFEDPPYQGNHDLIDMTNPSYRASHPSARIVPGPSGGPFQSTYPESPDMWSSTAMEAQVLEKVVSDYNSSGNPGHFVVRRLSDGSFDVIGDAIHDDTGANVPIIPILDTPIYLPKATRVADEPVRDIVAALSKRSGAAIVIASSANHPIPWRSTMGGFTAPARDWLMQVLDGWAGARSVWIFGYNPQRHQYVLNVMSAMRAEYDAFGQKHMLIPVNPLPLPPPPGGPQ